MSYTDHQPQENYVVSDNKQQFLPESNQWAFCSWLGLYYILIYRFQHCNGVIAPIPMPKISRMRFWYDLDFSYLCEFALGIIWMCLSLKEWPQAMEQLSSNHLLLNSQVVLHPDFSWADLVSTLVTTEGEPGKHAHALTGFLSIL